MLNFGSSHSIVTRGSRVSRASAHHTLLAFLNLNGTIFAILSGNFYRVVKNLLLRNKPI